MAEHSVPVTVLGTDRMPVGTEREHGIIFSDGKLFLPIEDRILCCPDTAEAREFLKLLSEAKKAPPAMESLTGLYRRLVTEGDTGAAIRLTELYGISANRSRCAILFERTVPSDRSLLPILTEYAPTEEADVLIGIGTDEVLLLRACEDPEVDENTEYAKALMDTVYEETGTELRCGIGGICSQLNRLASSYSEAMDALRLGREFRLKGQVFQYRKMLLEQILTRIPPEQRKNLRKLIFNEKNKRMLTDEIKETVGMFFQSDLNLSDTARRMFIHRNTLTYRLDKICKETGLDLRHFEDAAIFRILSELPDEED